MNKQRRETIEKLEAKFQELCDEIQEILDEEQEYYDNMPESLQSGDKGDLAQNAISNLESAQSDAESVINYLNSARE